MISSAFPSAFITFQRVFQHVFHILSPLLWRKISDTLCYGCAELTLAIKLVQQMQILFNITVLEQESK